MIAVILSVFALFVLLLSAGIDYWMSTKKTLNMNEKRLLEAASIMTIAGAFFFLIAVLIAIKTDTAKTVSSAASILRANPELAAAFL